MLLAASAADSTLADLAITWSMSAGGVMNVTNKPGIFYVVHSFVAYSNFN
jgi:hypothetical protein